MKLLQVHVMTDETVKQQLNAQGVHIPLHAIASMERSRQAILQLGAASLTTHFERNRLVARFVKMVRHQCEQVYHKRPIG